MRKLLGEDKDSLKEKKKIKKLASSQLKPQSSQSALQKILLFLPESHSTEQQQSCKDLKDAHLREEGNSMEFLPETVGEDVVLHGLDSPPEVRTGSDRSVGERSTWAARGLAAWQEGQPPPERPKGPAETTQCQFRIRTAF